MRPETYASQKPRKSAICQYVTVYLGVLYSCYYLITANQ